MLRPFVFPRYIVADGDRRRARPQPPDQARARAAAPRRRRSAGFDLKNGEGGIREIEFFVQALQLDPRRQAARRCAAAARSPRSTRCCSPASSPTTSTSRCGARIAGCATPSTCCSSRAACRRRRVPEDAAARDVLARRLGYADARGVRARARAPHRGGRAAVRDARRRRADERSRPTSRAILRGELAEDERGRGARAARLRRRHRRARRARARAAPTRARRCRRPRPSAPARIGAALLAEIAASADPDQALRCARRSDRAARRGVVDLAPARRATRRSLRLLGSLFGASAYLARTLVDTPELIDLLVELGQTVADARRVAQVARRPRGAARRPSIASDPEAVWSAIAEVKNGHVLRVGLADFAGALDPLAVCVELTAIAEACLRRRSRSSRRSSPSATAARPATRRSRCSRSASSAAASSATPPISTSCSCTPATRASRRPVPLARRVVLALAQRLLGALRQRTPRGRLYEVDTRLRPSGSQGLLVSSLAAWRRYHARGRAAVGAPGADQAAPGRRRSRARRGGRAARGRDGLRRAARSRRARSPTRSRAMRERDRARARRQASISRSAPAA